MLSFSERSVFVVALLGLKVWNIVDTQAVGLVGFFRRVNGKHGSHSGALL